MKVTLCFEVWTEIRQSAKRERQGFGKKEERDESLEERSGKS